MKYSIIIPTYNALNYLKDCIESVIQQDFCDYELIVSDNRSQDDTYAYVASLQHPNIRLVQPTEHLTMAEHWEFALAKARGDWVIIVGSDDGLMPYFFSLAEILTSLAAEQGYEIIGSERVYYFWEGCQDTYGDISYSYAAQNVYTIRPSFEKLLRTLLCEYELFISLPHAYTSSLVHKNLLTRIKKKQNFQLITSLTPDSSLACSIMLESHAYIHSFIPLGIVGSSANSNGLKYFLGEKNEFDAYRQAKKLRWNEKMGNITNKIHPLRFHLFEAFLNTLLYKRHEEFREFYDSHFFMLLVFSTLYRNILTMNNVKQVESLKNFTKLCTLHNISLDKLLAVQKSMSSAIEVVFQALYLSEKLHYRPIIHKHEMPQIDLRREHSSTDCHRLMDYWNKVRLIMNDHIRLS